MVLQCSPHSWGSLKTTVIESSVLRILGLGWLGLSDHGVLTAHFASMPTAASFIAKYDQHRSTCFHQAHDCSNFGINPRLQGWKRMNRSGLWASFTCHSFFLILIYFAQRSLTVGFCIKTCSRDRRRRSMQEISGNPFWFSQALWTCHAALVLCLAPALQLM